MLRLNLENCLDSGCCDTLKSQDFNQKLILLQKNFAYIQNFLHFSKSHDALLTI